MSYKNSDKSRIKILVACHKADPNIRQDDIYLPIQVGKALHPELDLGFQCDNTGDNISEKNGSYCELTALYWAWKNLKDVDYIGLCHYRRYFDMDTEALIRLASEKRYLIISRSEILPNSLFDELSKWTSYEDFYIFIDAIIRNFPEYKEDIIKFYFCNNRFPKCNMFFLAKNEFDEYCEFAFRILMDVESRIKIPNYNRQKRVIGYLAETLIGLWLLKNGNKYIEVNVREIGADTCIWKEVIKRIKANIGFFFSKRFTIIKDIPYYPPVKTGLEADGIKLTF